jgi:hypothetical protein
VHAPTEDKDDDIKDSFYEELEQIFDQFLTYHMKTLMEDFNGKWRGRAFLNQYLVMRVYMKPVMITVSE